MSVSAQIVFFSFRRTLHNAVNVKVPAARSEKAVAIEDVLAEAQMSIAGKTADAEQKTSRVKTR